MWPDRFALLLRLFCMSLHLHGNDAIPWPLISWKATCGYNHPISDTPQCSFFLGCGPFHLCPCDLAFWESAYLFTSCLKNIECWHLLNTSVTDSNLLEQIPNVWRSRFYFGAMCWEENSEPFKTWTRNTLEKKNYYKQQTNTVKLQDTKSMYKNPLLSCILTMTFQKKK